MTLRTARPSRRPSARVSSRAVALLAGAVLALGLAGCGDNSDAGSEGSGNPSESSAPAGSGGPSGSSGTGGPSGSEGSDSSGDSDSSAGSDVSGRSAPAGTPEEAYANFAGAIESNNADAFDAAVHDNYWSDLTEKQGDNAANLAVHHWAAENGVMTLPAVPEKVLMGDDAVGPDAQPGAADGYADKIGQMLGLKDLTGDDLAIVTVADAFDSGLANRAETANCIEDDKAIDACLDDTSSTGLDGISVILVRGDDGWQVFGTEPAN